MRRLLFAAAVTALVTACATGAAGDTPSPPVSNGQPRPPSISEAEIAERAQRWRSLQLSNYTYQIDVSCFCLFEHGMPLTATVHGGQSVSFTWADGAPLSPTDYDYDWLKRLDTIDGVFEVLMQLRMDADIVIAGFDAAVGYPTLITVDHNYAAVDDESTYTIGAFSIVEPREVPRTGGWP